MPKKQKYLLAAVLAAVVLGSAVLAVRFLFGGPEDSWICVDGQWVEHGHPAAAKPETPCPGPGAAPAAPSLPSLPKEMNFYESGPLSRSGQGQKPGVWSLAVERLGAAAQVVELEFDQASVCQVNGRAAACGALDLADGSRTRVEGYRLDQGSVLVRNLIFPSPFK